MTRPSWILRLLSPLCVLLLWELASRTGVLNPLLFPAPSRALVDLWVLITSGYLAKALYASLFRVACGFAIAVATGVVLGAAMARIRLVSDLFDPLVELLRPISALALYPLAILWFGIGDASKIFIIALAASFPVILNTFAGVRNIDANLFRAARSLGASDFEIFKGIVLPGSLPHIFTGVRLAWGISLIVIIAAEMVGVNRGHRLHGAGGAADVPHRTGVRWYLCHRVDRLCDRSRFPPSAPGPDAMVSRD